MRERAIVELRELEIFLAICELSSMTAAAKRLGLTQPAVSASLQQLEKKLETLLIDRRKRPLMPTMAGYWLQRSALRIVDETRQIPISMRNLNRGSSLRLRLGLIDCLSHPFASTMVKRLRPSIHYLSVSSGLAQNLRAGLVERRLGLIITNDALDGIDGVTRRPLLQEPYLLMVPRRLRAFAMSRPIQEVFKKLPLIRWSSRSNIGSQIELHLRRMGIDPPKRFEFESSNSVLGTVASGLGCAIVTPLLLSGSTQLLDEVAVVPFPGPKFSRQIELGDASLRDRSSCRANHGIALEILREQYLSLLSTFAPASHDSYVLGGSSTVQVGKQKPQVDVNTRQGEKQPALSSSGRTFAQ